VKDEGKTVLSSNIAISLARTSQRVLLIDGDCHQGSAARIFGASGSPGLTDWWRSQQPIQEYLKRVTGFTLWLLPAGSQLEQPGEMLQSARLADLLKEVSSWFDWVVVDSPPSAPLADATIWGKMADGILLVTREGKTPKRLLKKVLDSVDSSKLLGIVLNDCSDPDQHYYSSYYNLQKKH
jgi:receptor protein-tyrosine kinase